MGREMAFLTVKDKKSDFPTRMSHRLINPSQPQTSQVSQFILSRINKDLRVKIGLRQWKSADDTLKWFSKVKSTRSTKFNKFDIDKFVSFQ